MGVAALVLGIIGVLFSMNPWLFWVGIPLSVLALVLGIVESKRANADPANKRPSGAATAGIILGIIGTALGVLVFAACAVCAKRVSDLGKTLDKLPKTSRSSYSSPSVSSSGPPAEVGESVTFADSVWVVKKVRDLGGKMTVHGRTAETTGRFVAVTFQVKNLGRADDQLFDLPPVSDGEGREWKPFAESGSYLTDGQKSLAMANLPPGLSKEFTEIYELPADASDLRFRARALVAMGATREVLLGLDGGKPKPPPKPAPTVELEPPKESPKPVVDQAATPAQAAACTITKAFGAHCAPCVSQHCCATPVAYEQKLATAVGCRIGCRKPQKPTLSADQAALALQMCLSGCASVFPSKGNTAQDLDTCIANNCTDACLK